MSRSDRVLRPGRNCWRVARASRVSFLVDGAAYFEAFASAVERARRSVLIVGWDIHSRTVLRPDGDDLELADFLYRAVERRPELEVRLLEWDFSVLFALERDWTPVFQRGEWLEHRRLEFRFDDRHPFGASQHQKLVIVDDELAFTGGLDLTVGRWDTPEHLGEDARRRLPDREPYAPFHDVQIAIAGEAARALGELARFRWERATGETLEMGAAGDADPWPSELTPDLLDVPVAIARTLPSEEREETIREVERLYLDAIAAARRLIYVENQYFTSSRIAAALEERLSEREGPEVVLVLPRDCHGWLEESTMGALRGRLLERLDHADVHGRLRTVYPSVAGVLGEEDRRPVNVHAKVLVVDDRLLRIGSSNLSNRSMGFDSECDVAIESEEEDGAVVRAIRAFRQRLLAEHLGWTADEVRARLEERRSLVALLDDATPNRRALTPIAIERNDWEALLPDRAVVDPDGPEAPGRVAEEFLREDLAETTGNPWLRMMLVLAVLLVLAAAWSWTPLGEWVRPEKLSELAEAFGSHALAPVVVVLLYVVGSLLMVPITGLILATALTFEPLPAIGYSLLGSVAAGLAGFAIGHRLARDTVRRLAGSRLNRLSRLLARRGVVAVMALRVLPAGPFTVVNVVAGASHIRWRDFTLGTLLGLAPGILAVNLFKVRVVHALREPGWDSVLLVAVVLVVIVLGLAWARRALTHLEHDEG